MRTYPKNKKSKNIIKIFKNMFILNFLIKSNVYKKPLKK